MDSQPSGARRYDAFLLTRQPPSVENTLPQASAETSKTRSNFNEGVLYGLFCFFDSGAFSSGFFLSIMVSSLPLLRAANIGVIAGAASAGFRPPRCFQFSPDWVNFTAMFVLKTEK